MQETVIFPRAWLVPCASERSGHRAKTQAAGLLAAINRLAITISLHQMEGPCTSGAFPVVACIVGASQARQQKEPIMR